MTHKKVNATAVDIDVVVDSKFPTFNENEIERLYKAKCKDLVIGIQNLQLQRFQEVCKKICINRKAIFVEMSLGKVFAQEMALIMRCQRDRLAVLDLHKNNLGDAGVKLLLPSIAKSRTLIHFNIASNDITNDGMMALFSGMLRNESLTELNVSTMEGIARNRISLLGVLEIKRMLQNNKFISILDISSLGIGNDGFDLICDALINEDEAQLMSSFHNKENTGGHKMSH